MDCRGWGRGGRRRRRLVEDVGVDDSELVAAITISKSRKLKSELASVQEPEGKHLDGLLRLDPFLLPQS